MTENNSGVHSDGALLRLIGDGVTPYRAAHTAVSSDATRAPAAANGAGSAENTAGKVRRDKVMALVR